MSKVRLGDVVARIKDSVDRNNTDLELYVGGEHIDGFTLTVTKYGLIKGSTIGPAFSTKFKSGDVLLMSRNPHLRKAGLVSFDGICSDVTYILRTKDEKKLLQKYIPLILQSSAFWTFAEKNKKGSTNFFLNWSDFEEFKFELPSVDIQEQQCEAVWSIFETLESYKKMKFMNNEMIQAKLLELFGDPVKNTKGLPTKPLEKCVSFKTPKDIPERDEYWNLNLDMVESDSGKIIQKVFVKKEELGTSVYYFNENYVLYSKLRPYLNKVAMPDEDGFATTELVPMLPEKFINKTYLACVLRSKEFVNWINGISSGTKMPRAPMNDVKKFNLIVPKIEEQNEYEVFVNKIEESNLHLDDAIRTTTDLFNGLLNKYIKEE